MCVSQGHYPLACDKTYSQSSLSIKYIAPNIATVSFTAKDNGFVPLCTLLNIYRSLIFPYMSYGLAAWGQAAKTHLQKRLILHKRVLRLMYFSQPRAHAVSLFITSNILSINMLYVEAVSSLMYNVSCLSVPSNISDLFTKVNEIHTHTPTSSFSVNFYINSSSPSLNQRSFSGFMYMRHSFIRLVILFSFIF